MASQAMDNSVPGHNNATYGPVPRAAQIFEVEFLEVTPTPIPEDQFFFVLLRGHIPSSKRRSLNDTLLANAILDITLSANLSSGEREEPVTYPIPLETKTWRNDAHIAIRDESGEHVKHLPVDGLNDILADFQIISWFVRKGDWTFELVAKLPDGRCLFALSYTQFLRGWP